MFKKIYEYVSTHGMVLMLAAFGVMSVSLIIIIKTHSRVASGCAIAALVVYAIGRFFVAANRQRSRKKERDITESEDDL